MKKLERFKLFFVRLFCKHIYQPQFDYDGNLIIKNNKYKSCCSNCGKQKYVYLTTIKQWIDLQKNFQFGCRFYLNPKEQYKIKVEFIESKKPLTYNEKQFQEALSDYNSFCFCNPLQKQIKQIEKNNEQIIRD